jgi:hypothetical protein
MSVVTALIIKYWKYIAAVLALVALVAAFLCYRSAVYAAGQVDGRNEIRATELASCKAEYADLQKAAALQSAAVAVLGREAKEAQAKASAVQAVAQKQHAVAERRVVKIVAIPASECGSAAREVWGMVQ